MGVFDKILRAEESLFKNVDALDPQFVPKIVPFREEQQRAIEYAILPLFSDRNGKNLVLHGLPGVGKTVACKKVLQELEDKTDEILPLYVNCWQKNTSYKVALSICEQLGYRFTQNKKTDELFDDVVKLLNKKKAVFVFDEIDKAEEFDFLYTLLEEVYRKAIILLTNFKSFLDELDDRIKSRLLPELVEFKPYTLDETKGILKQRVEYAFHPNVWETDAFLEIAKKSAELKDIRAGIQLLKDAGDKAEMKASRKVTPEHASEAIQKLEEMGVKGSTDLLDDDKVMMETIKKHSNTRIGELYREYQDAGGDKTYKTFQRRMKNLEEQGYVALTRQEGAGGNTTIVEYKEKTKRLTEF